MFSHSRNTPYGAQTHVVSRLRVHLKYLLTTFIILPHLSSRQGLKEEADKRLIRVVHNLISSFEDAPRQRQ